MSNRIKHIERFMKYPIETQQKLLLNLLSEAKRCETGLQYQFAEISTVDSYKARVPLQSYEDVFPQIDRMMHGEANILWPGLVKWFAKSSGTTNAKSKFIPVSKDVLHDCHYKGGKDLIAMYFHNNPDSKMFDGKGLAMGGAFTKNELFPDSYYGDVSAVIMANLPSWAEYASTPGTEISLMSEWEQKLEKMSEATIKENVTSISGVPTWVIVLLEKILQKTGKQNILEVWPNFEVYFHGAVAFQPYQELFKKLFPTSDIKYMEIYNASEGFFALKDAFDRDDMLLMLDNGVYYEFIPVDDVDKDEPTVLDLSQVQLHTNYAMVITTNGGLWRYKIGDTVRFTTLYPFRIKITGRTKHFINTFGEELVIENAETAMLLACKKTDAIMTNFTAAPSYMAEQTKGAHEWVIEFAKPPADKATFVKILDEHIKQLNSDYEAKRYKDYILQLPKVNIAPAGTFYTWMKGKNKLGAQNKVPRLANDRVFIDDLIAQFGSEFS